MVRLHPVSGSVLYLGLSAETDEINEAEQVVCVPVCISSL